MHSAIHICIHLIIGTIATIIIDSFWFTLTMKSFYKPQLQLFIGSNHKIVQTNLLWAVLSWSVMTIGNYFFVLYRSNGKFFETFLWGMAYGAIIYFVYNASNKGVFSSWPLYIVIVDSLWGALLNGSLSIILVLIKRCI